MLFSDARSCPKTIFSDPLMMKYPPQSIGHSLVNIGLMWSFWLNTHISDFTIIGIFPILILGISFFMILGVSIVSVFRTMYSISKSTFIVDAYVKFRRLASSGNIIFTAPLFSWIWGGYNLKLTNDTCISNMYCPYSGMKSFSERMTIGLNILMVC